MLINSISGNLGSADRSRVQDHQSSFTHNGCRKQEVVREDKVCLSSTMSWVKAPKSHHSGGTFQFFSFEEEMKARNPPDHRQTLGGSKYSDALEVTRKGRMSIYFTVSFQIRAGCVH